MLGLDHNSGYILASYGVTFLLMGLFVWVTARRYAAAKRKLTKVSGHPDG
jgi:heme exporter protein CcmD